jgi:hypothetical protein
MTRSTPPSPGTTAAAAAAAASTSERTRFMTAARSAGLLCICTLMIFSVCILVLVHLDYLSTMHYGAGLVGSQHMFEWLRLVITQTTMVTAAGMTSAFRVPFAFAVVALVMPVVTLFYTLAPPLGPALLYAAVHTATCVMALGVVPKDFVGYTQMAMGAGAAAVAHPPAMSTLPLPPIHPNPPVSCDVRRAPSPSPSSAPSHKRKNK